MFVFYYEFINLAFFTFVLFLSESLTGTSLCVYHVRLVNLTVFSISLSFVVGLVVEEQLSFF